jgi:predicted Zn-dependent peptidase
VISLSRDPRWVSRMALCLVACLLISCASPPPPVQVSDARQLRPTRTLEVDPVAPNWSVAPSADAPIGASGAIVREARLNNGMRILVRQRSNAFSQQVYLMIRRGTGSTQSMLPFVHARTVLVGEGYDTIARSGGGLRIADLWDAEVLEVSTLPAWLEHTVALLSRSFMRPGFDMGSLEEATQNIQRAAERNAFDVNALAAKFLFPRVLPGQRQPSLFPEDVERAPSYDDLLRYHSDLSAAEVVLLFDGAASLETCVAILRDRFVYLGKDARPVSPPARFAAPTFARTIFVERRGTPSAHVVFGYPSPPFASEAYLQSLVLAASLSRNLSGLLFESVRQHAGDSYGVHVGQWARAQGGMFQIWTTLEGVRAAHAFKTMVRTLEELNLTDADLAIAKAHVERELSNPDPGFSGLLQSVAAADVPLDALKRMREQLPSVTVQSLQALAKDMFQKRNVVIMGERSVLQGLRSEGVVVDQIENGVF